MVCRIKLILAAFIAAVTAQDLPVSQRNFADELTTALYEDDTNECTSSLGVSMAFSLVYPSMIDNSKNEVAEVLGFPENNTSVLVWNGTQTDLNTLYDGSCLLGDSDNPCDLEQPTVVISNSIWVNSGDGRTLNIAYEQLVKDLLFFIDFRAADAGTTVNQWVDNASRGLIDSIVEDAPIDLILLAVNVIYLKANWLMPFLESKTNQDIFFNNDGSTAVRQDALFMHNVEYYKYSHEAVPGFQIVQIPFAGGTLHMIFVLPAGSIKLDSTTLIDAIPNLESTRVALALPKFQFESKYEENLEETLQAIGIVESFFGGICVYEGDCDAYIEFVIQKTYISLDEKGVEAAAVTAIGVDESAPVDQPVLMQLDRPFQFFIYDSSTDLMIFEGQVVNPIPQDDAPAAQLTTSHADSSFWMDGFFVEPLVVELTGFTPTIMPTTMESTTTMKPTEQETTTTPEMTTTPTTAPTTRPSTSSATISGPASAFLCVSITLTMAIVI